MAKGTATDEEILRHHLVYEFDMLQGTYLELDKGGHNQVISNALIEAFCLHARLLIEFFNNRQGRQAKEFTGGTYNAAHINSLGSAKKKLNTQIAHLTGERTTDDSHKIGPGDRSKLLAALEREAQNFVFHLTPAFKGMFTLPEPIRVIPTCPKQTSPSELANI